MNELAPRPSLPAHPIPYGLVSLWDMMNWILTSFYWSTKHLNTIADLCQRDPRAPLDTMLINTIRSNIDAFKDIATEMGLEATHDRIELIGNFLDINKALELDKSWAASQLKTLVEIVEGEIKRQHFYHYPRLKAELVLKADKDWAAVLRAFPSVGDDVLAATDCYALGQDHASIHHSMMVLEVGLPAVATKLGVKFNPDKATWADMTREIVKKIASERLALSHTPKGGRPPNRSTAKKKSAFLEACEEAAIEFRYFTTVWRNHIAHGRGDYDENDAKKVLEHVRTFMEVIATKLKLRERTA